MYRYFWNYESNLRPGLSSSTWRCGSTNSGDAEVGESPAQCCGMSTGGQGKCGANSIEKEAWLTAA